MDLDALPRLVSALVEAHRAFEHTLKDRHLTTFDARERTFASVNVPASTGTEVVLVDAVDFYRDLILNPRANYILVSNRAQVSSGNAFRIGLDANLLLPFPAGSRLYALSATVSAIQVDITFLNYPGVR